MHCSEVRLFSLCLRPICMDVPQMHLKKDSSLIWLKTEIHVVIYWLRISLGYLKQRHFHG